MRAKQLCVHSKLGFMLPQIMNTSFQHGMQSSLIQPPRSACGMGAVWGVHPGICTASNMGPVVTGSWGLSSCPSCTSVSGHTMCTLHSACPANYIIMLPTQWTLKLPWEMKERLHNVLSCGYSLCTGLFWNPLNGRHAHVRFTWGFYLKVNCRSHLLIQ